MQERKESSTQADFIGEKLWLLLSSVNYSYERGTLNKKLNKGLARLFEMTSQEEEAE